ncbi:MAG: tetratricopeptide repeat protein [Chloroflexi bacterium]|nr:tetratricopeptide repeat protein [Chloroflexota bacterium]
MNLTGCGTGSKGRGDISGGNISNAGSAMEQSDTNSPINSLSDIKESLDKGDINQERAWQILNPLLKEKPDDAGLLLLKSRLLWSEDRLDESQKILDIILEKNPDDKDAIAFKARMLLDQFDNEDADKMLENPGEFSPDEYQEQLLVARGLFQEQKYKKAETKLLDIIKKRPDYVDAYLLLADVYDGGLQPEKGKKFLESALKRKWPNNADKTNLFVRLGEIYERKGREDEAVKYFKKALKVKPDNSFAKAKISMCTNDFEIPGELEEGMTKSLDSADGSSYAYFALAKIYYNDGRKDRGRRMLYEALKKFPLEMEGYYLLGQFSFEDKEYSESQMAYAHSRALQVEDYDTFLGRALLDLVRRDFDSANKILSVIKIPKLLTVRHYRKVGDTYLFHLRDYETARKYYNKALKYRGPDDDTSMALANLGSIELKENRDSEAEKYFQRAIRQIPGDISIYTQIIPAMILNRRYDTARRYMSLYEKNKSGMNKKVSDALHVRCAYSYMMNGDFEEARKILDKAMKVNPYNPVVENLMGKIEMLQGNNKKAGEYFKWLTEKNITDTSMLIFQGLIAEEEGDKSGAGQYYNRAGESLGNSGEVEYQKAWIYSLKRNKAESLRYLREACNKDIYYAARAYSDEAFDWMRGDPFFQSELPGLIKQIKSKKPFPSAKELKW